MLVSRPLVREWSQRIGLNGASLDMVFLQIVSLQGCRASLASQSVAGWELDFRPAPFAPFYLAEFAFLDKLFLLYFACFPYDSKTLYLFINGIVSYIV